MGRPEARADVRLMEGYHSPQVDVDVRLNTNEAPEPPPETFVAALKVALDGIAWNRYPDRSASALRARLAEVEGRHVPGGLTAANVFAANGSNEVLQSLCLAYGGTGRRALSFEPTYALHTHIAKVTGTGVVEVDRNEDFTIDLDRAVEAVEQHRPVITFLCSPNNPTGRVEDEATVRALLEAVERVDGLLVVDEAYGQFARWSAQALVHEDAPVVVTRTYSKTWSAAALRLGYLVGPTWVVAELEKVVLPYHLDSITQIAGQLALDHLPEMEARVERLVAERERLVEGLARLPVEQWPSGANFVLFRPTGRDGARVWSELVERSVLVRNCASWPRLEGCLRVTVGTRAENEAFLAALGEVLGVVAL